MARLRKNVLNVQELKWSIHFMTKEIERQRALNHPLGELMADNLQDIVDKWEAQKECALANGKR